MTHHSKGPIEENTMHYILKLEYSEVIQIIAIILLFLTVYSQYFSKVFLLTLYGALYTIVYNDNNNCLR